MDKRIRDLIENHEECLDNGSNVLLLDIGEKEKFIGDTTKIIKDYLIEFLEYIYKSNDKLNEMTPSEIVTEWINK